MPQNGQTHIKNLAANAARFLKCDHFGTLWDIIVIRKESHFV